MILNQIFAEIEAALPALQATYGPFTSWEQAESVIREEVDEFTVEVRNHHLLRMEAELFDLIVCSVRTLRQLRVGEAETNKLRDIHRTLMQVRADEASAGEEDITGREHIAGLHRELAEIRALRGQRPTKGPRPHEDAALRRVEARKVTSDRIEEIIAKPGVWRVKLGVPFKDMDTVRAAHTHARKRLRLDFKVPYSIQLQIRFLYQPKDPACD